MGSGDWPEGAFPPILPPCLSALEREQGHMKGMVNMAVFIMGCVSGMVDVKSGRALERGPSPEAEPGRGPQTGAASSTPNSSSSAWDDFPCLVGWCGRSGLGQEARPLKSFSRSDWPCWSIHTHSTKNTKNVYSRRPPSARHRVVWGTQGAREVLAEGQAGSGGAQQLVAGS